MLMKRILVLSIISGSVLAVHGITVECEAGFLGTKISNPETVSELVLRGSADASDFYFIERSMPGLRSLDMSGLRIVAYNGAPLGALSCYKAGEIPAAVFAGSEITDIVLPAECSIGDFAFSGSRISEISLPAGTSVGEGVFYQCRQLKSVTFAPDLSIGHSAFRDCAALATVVNSESIKEIPAHAFEGCVSLEKFSFGPDLRSVGESAFSGSSLKTADMSACSQLDSIGAWAFAGDASLEKFMAPSHLGNIGKGIFFECGALADVVLPDGISELPAYAFKDVTSMESSVILPENIVSIGEYALMGASSVTSVELPGSLETIGHGAMEGMSSLNSVDALSLLSVPALGEGVWAGVAQKNVVLNVDPSMQEAFESTPQWQEFSIQGTSTSSAIPVAGESKIRVASDGHMLIVQSIGAAINSILICDIAGKYIFNKSGIQADTIRVDMSAHDTAVYIIDCTLSDGTRGSAKILR